MVDILQVLEGAAYLGFIAGAIFAVYELRDMKKSRDFDLMMRLNESWLNRDFVEATVKVMRADFATAKEAEEQCSAVTLKLVADYFDSYATLIRSGLADAARVPLAFETCYGKLEPWIVGWEETVPGRYDDLRWIANEQRNERLAAEQKEKAG